jgi:hypothetical protein
MSVSWIEHKGIKILYTDWRQKAPKQLLELLYEYTETIKSIDESVVIHRISDMRGVPISNTMLNLGKEFGKDVFAKRKGKSIFLGANGLRKFYFQVYKFATGYNTETKESLDEALDYIYQSTQGD